jgi:HAD superfamily hydrolase (TIGR01509 family)
LHHRCSRQLHRRERFNKQLNMIKALIFDFDGLIIDTETPELLAWQEIYREHGQVLSARTWGQIVGGSAASDFEPVAHLAALTGDELDFPRLKDRVREQSLALINRQPPLPGVQDYLEDGRRLGLGLAIASSSAYDWVDGHLRRLGLFHYFDTIKAREDVLHTKPEPDLFLSALSALGAQPNQAIVFEDSPNGVTAAKRAGIFVVAVPNPLTAQLKFEGEDLRLASLTESPLESLLRKIQTH